MKRSVLLNLIFVITMISLILFSIKIDFFFPTPETGLTTEDIPKQKTPINTSLGTNPDAPIELIEFSDFSCSYCKQSYPELKKLLKEKEINFVYKHLPRDDQSFKAAIASECARDQDKFLDYHDLLFESDELSEENLLYIAELLNLDMEEFKACMLSEEKVKVIMRDIKDAESNGITGTPIFIINGDVIIGSQSYESLKDIIEKQLDPERITREILGDKD